MESDGITIQLKNLLDEYSEELGDALEVCIDRIAKETVQKLKSSSPRGKSAKHYADGWTSKKERGRIRTTIVYNKTKPGLTHLLENGHAKVNGGRVDGITHIKPVEEWANAELVAEIERIRL